MRQIHASALGLAFAVVIASATTATAKFPGQLQPGPNEIADDVARAIKHNETKEFGAKFDPLVIEKIKIKVETDNGNHKLLTLITEGVTPQCALTGLEEHQPARLFAVVTDGQLLQKVELRSFSSGKSGSQPLTEIHRSGPLHIPNPTQLTLVFHGKCTGQ